MTDPTNSNPAPAATRAAVDLVSLLTILGTQKRLVAIVAAAGLLISLSIALLTTPIYTARTTLMPPQQSQSSVLAGSLGALAATAGLSAGLKMSEEFYAALLRTDVVSDSLIAAHKLKERYNLTTLVDTRRRLLNNVRITTDRKSSLIHVEVDDKDPAFAATLANAYADELKKLLTRVDVTAAQQRRVFYEGQMKKVKDELVAAEVAAKLAQERGGVMSLDAQTQGAITSAAQLRAQIVAREVQLKSIRSYAGPQHPDHARIQSELQSLRTQLAKLEGLDGIPADTAVVDRKESVSDALTNVRAYRELKYQEAMYTALMQQFQVAKADESKEAPLVQQIGMATPPDRKSKPSRALIVIVGSLFGLLFGIAAAFGRHVWLTSSASGEAATRWHALSRAWSLRH